VHGGHAIQMSDIPKDKNCQMKIAYLFSPGYIHNIKISEARGNNFILDASENN
jgi:hypothetical protein